MTFVSYAQNFEDIILRRALRDVSIGFYIDVGASDPDVHSVTKAFYLGGWRGINIDPVLESFNRLQAERGEDINLRLAAGAAPGLTTLYEIPDTGLSTIDRSIAERHRESGHTVVTSNITIRTLSSVCAEHVKGEIHFLKIDVEGAERDVLLGLDLKRWRPWIIVIEAMVPMAQQPNHHAWEPLVVCCRYRFAYAGGLNRYYIAEEHADLSASFEYPPNVFDDFVSIAQQDALQHAQAADQRAQQADQQAQAADQRAQAADQQAQAANRRAQVADATAADLAGRNGALREQLVAEIAAGESAAARLQEREALLDLVYRSRSWRITAPLRTLAGTLRRRTASSRADAAAAAPTVPTVPTVPTMFIECTHTYHSDLNTGIQRVVRNVLRHAGDVAAGYGYEVVPVVLDGDRLVGADLATVLRDKTAAAEDAPDGSAATTQHNPTPRFRRVVVNTARPVWRFGLRSVVALLPSARVRRFVYAPPHQRGLSRSFLLMLRCVGWRSTRLNPPVPATTGLVYLDQRMNCAGDILLLLDSSWATPIWPAVRRFKARGGHVAAVIYDLIPVNHPYTCVPELVDAFAAWLDEHMALTDAFIGISRSTSREVADYFAAVAPDLPAAPITHFHLGSELDLITTGKDVRPQVREIFAAPRHIFLMVGSIEPRKNHPFILDAFDRFWQQGGDAVLVMIGRHGWKTDSFLARVAGHAEYGRRLHLLRDATDTELDHGYRNASALVIASTTEGFGLPVVEAFQRGLPVLCSDIPVFREIADGRARFFPIDNPDHLADALREFCASLDPRDRWRRTPRPWLTWRESTEQLVSALMKALAEIQTDGRAGGLRRPRAIGSAPPAAHRTAECAASRAEPRVALPVPSGASDAG